MRTWAGSPLCNTQEASKEKARRSGGFWTGIQKNGLLSGPELGQSALRALFSVAGGRTAEITEFRDEAVIPAALES